MKAKTLSVLFWIGVLLFIAEDLWRIYNGVLYVYGYVEPPEWAEIDPEKLKEHVVNDVLPVVAMNFASLALHSVMGVAFWLRGRE